MGKRKAVAAEKANRRTPWQRVMVGLGLVLVLGGVGLFGWIGWEMYGTNWISHRKQAAAIESIEKQWRAGEESVKVPAGRVTSIVRIPRFGDSYEVPILEGVSDDALAAGFGRFTEGAKPGDQGNFALAAHRVTHGEPLRDMPDLQPGDEIIIETRTATFTYVLDTGGDDLVVPFTDTWVLDRRPTNPDGGVQPDQSPGQRLITLTTCSELFHTDNRMIAFGHLKSRVARTS